MSEPSRSGYPGLWPTAFVALCLAALAIFPIVQDQRVSSIESDLLLGIEPLHDLTEDYLRIVTDAITDVQDRALRGDSAGSLDGWFDEADGVHGQLHERIHAPEMDGVLGSAAVEVRNELLPLTTRHASLRFERMPAAGLDATTFGTIAREQVELATLKSQALGLQSAVDRVRASGRAGVDRVRAQRTTWTVVLASLAIVATLALGVIVRRLRTLATEAERRRAESLRARRDMEAVLEASSDGVLSVDLDGKCISLNSTGARLLDRREIDVQGRHLYDILYGADRSEEHRPPEEHPAVRALASGQIEREVSDTIWRRDGTSFPAVWHLRPLVDGKEIRGGVITITDMTEVREAERALRDALRAREEVVAVVSHDLRNPLGTVLGAAELIDEFDLPPEKVKRQARAIRQAGGTMQRLIRDLLDVAKIEAGRFSVHVESEEVGALLENAVAPFVERAREGDTELRWSADEGLPPVRVDRDRFRQLLSNLLGNALKFTPAGGKVEVRAECGGPDSVRFMVRDTGKGIAPEHVEHLFDRFWQAEGADSRGTGLGLAIVKGIVDAHDGALSVESKVGSGTTISVTLPSALHAEASA